MGQIVIPVTHGSVRCTSKRESGLEVLFVTLLFTRLQQVHKHTENPLADAVATDLRSAVEKDFGLNSAE